ncbi:MAG: hypothetical protein ACK5PS_15730 [Desulfopila sp.]
MDKLKREYERFGPWVTEILGDEDIPPQFESFTETILRSDLSCKIPVSVERRELKPGMVFYDTVISLAGNHMVIWTLQPDGIDQQEIDITSIQYFQYAVAVLQGVLRCVTAQQTLSINFSSVELEPIDKIEQHIRDRYCPPEAKIRLEDIVAHENTEQSFLYEALLARAAKKEELKMITYQPTIKMQRAHVSMMRRWRVVSEEFGLQDSAFLTNGRELIVLSRIQDMKAVKKSDYGYRSTYIPLSTIRTIFKEPVAKVAGLEDLSIVMENTRVVFRVEERFPMDILRKALQL